MENGGTRLPDSKSPHELDLSLPESLGISVILADVHHIMRHGLRI